MKPFHYEVALPLIGRFLYYDPEICVLLRTCKHWREILFHHLHELTLSGKTHLPRFNSSQIIFHPSFTSIYLLSLNRVLSSDVIHLLSQTNTIRELRLSSISDYSTIPEVEEGRFIPLITRLTIQACAPTVFLHYLWKICSHLQELTLLNCSYIIDADLIFIQLNCPHLSKLIVNKSFGLSRPKLLDSVNDDKVKAKLSSLDLSHCPNIRQITMKTTPSHSTFTTTYLKYLNISFSKINNESLFEIFHSCSQLEEVKAEMCMEIRDDLTIQSKALKSLNLSHCIKLETLVLDCPALTTLKLEFSDSLQVIGFSSSLEHLRQLNLVLLKNLRVIDWNYGRIPSLSPSFLHPHLTKLNICGCLRFGEIADVSEDREAAEDKIRENMFNYPYYSKYIGKEEKSRIETDLIPLINWLIETIHCCPAFDWKVFFNHCIGGSTILAHLNLIKPMIYRIIDSI